MALASIKIKNGGDKLMSIRVHLSTRSNCLHWDYVRTTYLAIQLKLYLVLMECVKALVCKCTHSHLEVYSASYINIIAQRYRWSLYSVSLQLVAFSSWKVGMDDI